MCHDMYWWVCSAVYILICFHKFLLFLFFSFFPPCVGGRSTASALQTQIWINNMSKIQLSKYLSSWCSWLKFTWYQLMCHVLLYNKSTGTKHKKQKQNSTTISQERLFSFCMPVAMVIAIAAQLVMEYQKKNTLLTSPMHFCASKAAWKPWKKRKFHVECEPTEKCAFEAPQ